MPRTPMLSLCPQDQLAGVLSAAPSSAQTAPTHCQAPRLPLMTASGMGTSPHHLFIPCQAQAAGGVITHPGGQGFGRWCVRCMSFCFF